MRGSRRAGQCWAGALYRDAPVPPLWSPPPASAVHAHNPTAGCSPQACRNAGSRQCQSSATGQAARERHSGKLQQVMERGEQRSLGISTVEARAIAAGAGVTCTAFTDVALHCSHAQRHASPYLAPTPHHHPSIPLAFPTKRRQHAPRVDEPYICTCTRNAPHRNVTTPRPMVFCMRRV